jgi:hypothetical protein
MRQGENKDTVRHMKKDRKKRKDKEKRKGRNCVSDKE